MSIFQPTCSHCGERITTTTHVAMPSGFYHWTCFFIRPSRLAPPELSDRHREEGLDIGDRPRLHVFRGGREVAAVTTEEARAAARRLLGSP